jgi:translation initiation factor 3 subunit J
MSDDDWDNDDFDPTPIAATKTKGDLLLEKAKQPDQSKFAGEDEGEEEEPAWKSHIPQSQQKKEVPVKAYEKKGVVDYGKPLDDPAAEKLRLLKLQEQSDLNAFKDLIGGDSDQVDLNTFEPKSAKDFEALARTLVARHVTPYERDAKYKSLLKAIVKSMLAEADVQQVKDLEACLAGIRADKLKEEKAAAAAKKAVGKKKILNVGRGGGSAGLEDYQYDIGGDDDEDFM